MTENNDSLFFHGNKMILIKETNNEDEIRQAILSLCTINFNELQPATQAIVFRNWIPCASRLLNRCKCLPTIFSPSTLIALTCLGRAIALVTSKITDEAMLRTAALLFSNKREDTVPDNFNLPDIELPYIKLPDMSKEIRLITFAFNLFNLKHFVITDILFWAAELAISTEKLHHNFSYMQELYKTHMPVFSVSMNDKKVDLPSSLLHLQIVRYLYNQIFKTHYNYPNAATFSHLIYNQPANPPLIFNWGSASSQIQKTEQLFFANSYFENNFLELCQYVDFLPLGALTLILLNFDFNPSENLDEEFNEIHSILQNPKYKYQSLLIYLAASVHSDSFSKYVDSIIQNPPEALKPLIPMIKDIAYNAINRYIEKSRVFNFKATTKLLRHPEILPQIQNNKSHSFKLLSTYFSDNVHNEMTLSPDSVGMSDVIKLYKLFEHKWCISKESYSKFIDQCNKSFIQNMNTNFVTEAQKHLLLSGSIGVSQTIKLPDSAEDLFRQENLIQTAFLAAYYASVAVKDEKLVENTPSIIDFFSCSLSSKFFWDSFPQFPHQLVQDRKKEHLQIAYNISPDAFANDILQYSIRDEKVYFLITELIIKNDAYPTLEKIIQGDATTLLLFTKFDKIDPYIQRFFTTIEKNLTFPLPPFVLKILNINHPPFAEKIYAIMAIFAVTNLAALQKLYNNIPISSSFADIFFRNLPELPNPIPANLLLFLKDVANLMQKVQFESHITQYTPLQNDWKEDKLSANKVVKKTIWDYPSPLPPCTQIRTGHNFEDQPWFHCHTCNLVGNTGTCVSCALRCHRGHDITFSKVSSFFCDCYDHKELCQFRDDYNSTASSFQDNERNSNHTSTMPYFTPFSRNSDDDNDYEEDYQGIDELMNELDNYMDDRTRSLIMNIISHSPNVEHTLRVFCRIAREKGRLSLADIKNSDLPMHLGLFNAHQRAPKTSLSSFSSNPHSTSPSQPPSTQTQTPSLQVIVNPLLNGSLVSSTTTPISQPTYSFQPTMNNQPTNLQLQGFSFSNSKPNPRPTNLNSSLGTSSFKPETNFSTKNNGALPPSMNSSFATEPLSYSLQTTLNAQIDTKGSTPHLKENQSPIHFSAAINVISKLLNHSITPPPPLKNKLTHSTIDKLDLTTLNSHSPNQFAHFENVSLVAVENNSFASKFGNVNEINLIAAVGSNYDKLLVCENNKLKLFDTKAKQKLSTKALPFSPCCISVSPIDGTALAVASLNDVYIYTLNESTNEIVMEHQIELMLQAMGPSLFIVNIEWVPLEPFHLAVTCTGFVKIYDILQDCISPILCFLSNEKIASSFLATYNDEPYVFISTQTGKIAFNSCNIESQSGPTNFTNIIPLSALLFGGSRLMYISYCQESDIVYVAYQKSTIFLTHLENIIKAIDKQESTNIPPPDPKPNRPGHFYSSFSFNKPMNDPPINGKLNPIQGFTLEVPGQHDYLLFSAMNSSYPSFHFLRDRITGNVFMLEFTTKDIKLAGISSYEISSPSKSSIIGFNILIFGFCCIGNNLFALASNGLIYSLASGKITNTCTLHLEKCLGTTQTLKESSLVGNLSDEFSDNGEEYSEDHFDLFDNPDYRPSKSRKIPKPHLRAGEIDGFTFDVPATFWLETTIILNNVQIIGPKGNDISSLGGKPPYRPYHFDGPFFEFTVCLHDTKFVMVGIKLGFQSNGTTPNRIKIFNRAYYPSTNYPRDFYLPLQRSEVSIATPVKIRIESRTYHNVIDTVRVYAIEATKIGISIPPTSEDFYSNSTSLTDFADTFSITCQDNIEFVIAALSASPFKSIDSSQEINVQKDNEQLSLLFLWMYTDPKLSMNCRRIILKVLHKDVERIEQLITDAISTICDDNHNGPHKDLSKMMWHDYALLSTKNKNRIDKRIWKYFNDQSGPLGLASAFMLE